MPAVDDRPVVRRAADLAVDLAADATRLEREGVDRPLLDRMAADGLLAVSGPPALGGAWPAEQRRVAELLAGASPDAWFVWFQHAPVVRMLMASDNADLVARRLPDLCAGRLLGVALAALDLLAPRAPETADVLRVRVLDVRRRAYALLDQADGAERLDERLALRASALLLAVECCTALLTARGGQGMDLAEPAQRLLGAAAFQVVHSQAAHVRTATLVALAS